MVAEAFLHTHPPTWQPHHSFTFILPSLSSATDTVIFNLKKKKEAGLPVRKNIPDISSVCVTHEGSCSSVANIAVHQPKGDGSRGGRVQMSLSKTSNPLTLDEQHLPNAKKCNTYSVKQTSLVKWLEAVSVLFIWIWVLTVAKGRAAFAFDKAQWRWTQWRNK